MSRGFIPSVSRLTALRDVRSETTAFGLAFFSRESHETNVRLCEGKRPFPAYLFWSCFQREDRKKSHVSHPYREVILRLWSEKVMAVRLMKLGTHNETLSVVAMRVYDPDCSPSHLRLRKQPPPPTCFCCFTDSSRQLVVRYCSVVSVRSVSVGQQSALQLVFPAARLCGAL
jgi:hypothetical protein